MFPTPSPDLHPVPAERWERAAAIACHLGPLVGLPVLLAGGMLVGLPALDRPSAFVAQHARQAVVFQLGVLLVTTPLAAAMHFFFALILIGWPLAILLGLLLLVIVVAAFWATKFAVFAALRGRPAHLPFVGHVLGRSVAP